MDEILQNDEFILTSQSFVWTFAKTMPEYIVRGKTADDATYFAMFRAIESRGVWGEWNGTPRRYLHPGDGCYYWKMTDDMSESIIVNRAKENGSINGGVNC
jgi:hypothetical protein